MQTLRYIHRYATVIVVAFVLFLGVTGVLIQAVDLKSIALGRPANDPDVLAMRESFDGPADFAVRQASDYTARPLPQGFNYGAALGAAVRAVGGGDAKIAVRYVDFRNVEGQPVSRVGVGTGHLDVNPATGRIVRRVGVDVHDSDMPDTLRNDFKHLHRMTTFGDWALFINVAVSVGLLVLIVTGTLIYFKILQIRRKIRKPNPFWTAGGTWRSLHRSISIVAAVFLLIVSLSGAWLAVESLGLAVYFMRHPPVHRGERPQPAVVDVGALPSMLAVTLKAAEPDLGGERPVAVRLREYGGYRQGVVVTGGDASRQLVYDAASGRRMSLTEPGYPEVPFPFGWQAHQTAKSIHRGDYFGLTGRIMDLLAGFAMVYLSVSGLVMYWNMWTKRRNAGRKSLVWR